MLGYQLSASVSESAGGPTTGSDTFALYCRCSSGRRITIYHLPRTHRHSEETLAERIIKLELTQVELTQVELTEVGFVSWVMCLSPNLWSPDLNPAH